MTYDLDYIRKNNLIIFEARMGSHAYGTSLPTSDVDIRGVFVQPIEDILQYGFVDQVADTKNDIVFYELRRFANLLAKSNPNILELIAVPSDCVIYRHPIFSMIEENQKMFITKKCRLTFAGYAIAQIKKARGYNKKMNWEETEMTRKTVLDFCYILIDGGTMSLKHWLGERFTYDDFSLAAIDHAHDLYTMYYYPGGIVSDEQKANDVQLISIPKDIELAGYLTFNKDAYSIHCRRYKEYQTWLKERNEDRFKMNKEHGKNYDSKNMMHTFRLLKMAHEIADGELRVRRPAKEIETLMAIRHGEYDYEKLLTEAEEMIAQLDEKFDQSDIPKDVDYKFIQDLQYKMRKECI